MPQGQPSFSYLKENTSINISIDTIDWADFFCNKETIQIDFLFFSSKKKKKKKSDGNI